MFCIITAIGLATITPNVVVYGRIWQSYSVLPGIWPPVIFTVIETNCISNGDTIDVLREYVIGWELENCDPDCLNEKENNILLCCKYGSRGIYNNCIGETITNIHPISIIYSIIWWYFLASIIPFIIDLWTERKIGRPKRSKTITFLNPLDHKKIFLLLIYISFIFISTIIDTATNKPFGYTDIFLDIVKFLEYHRFCVIRCGNLMFLSNAFFIGTFFLWYLISCQIVWFFDKYWVKK